MNKVTVIGATSWGNTLGKILTEKGTTVNIWTRTEARAEELRREQKEQSSKTAPPPGITFTNNIEEALQSSEMVIWAIPAQNLRQNVKQLKENLTSSMILVNAAKGLEKVSTKRMTEVITEEVSAAWKRQVCVLSGPNLSQEISQGLPATSIIAAQDIEIAQKAQDALQTPDFYVFISDDIIGVELCGALKNVIALGAGITDGLGMGDNTKAALITLGWAEAVSIGTALGAKTETFYGLAGLGDIIATCASNLSRNHYVGFELAKGRPLAEVIDSMTNIAEGVDTAIAVHHLASDLGLKVPLIDIIYKVLYQSLPPVEILARFKEGLKSSR